MLVPVSVAIEPVRGGANVPSGAALPAPSYVAGNLAHLRGFSQS
jgi:hypothetical protein